MKIKEIKIVNQDESTEIADIGADAINIDYNDTTVKAELDKWNADNNPLALKLNKKPYYYDNVTAMKADTTLKAGDMAITLGYYTANDGGRAEYKIVNASIGYYELLNNNLQAELIIKDKMNVKQFGAKGNNNNDDTQKIQTSLDILNYAYLSKGTYKITNSLIIHSKGAIFGENLNESIIIYTGSGNALKNEDIDTCTKISIHDLSIIGNNKTGNGIYLYRTSKNDDAYHQIYRLNISYFENGIYASQYQNETKFNNLNILHCLNGINCYYLNDCYFSEIVSHNNDKDGIIINGSSEIRGSNIKCWYNGSISNAFYNLNIKASAAINLNNITLQESYYDNLNISSCKNININNIYLSWAGLNQSTPINQIVLDDSTNCSINGNSQNGHFNITGYDNNVLALKSHPYNCDVKIKTEFDFPSSQKMYLIGANNNFNTVFNRNNFEISNNSLKFNQTNYAKNGDISNTTSLSFVNNNSHCSYVDGKLRVDTTGETGNTNIYFQNIALPQNDFYTSYIKFKKVSGSGNVTFESPGYANIQASDEAGKEFYISMTKYSDTSKQFITMTLAKDIIIDISEFGIVLGESAKYETPINPKAIVL